MTGTAVMSVLPPQTGLPSMTICGFAEASPIGAAFVEAMLSKCLRQLATGDQHIEYVLESISLKLGMLASGPVVALKRGRMFSSRANR